MDVKLLEGRGVIDFAMDDGIFDGVMNGWDLKKEVNKETGLCIYGASIISMNTTLINLWLIPNCTYLSW